MIQGHRRHRAFTMMEVMVASAVMAVAIAAITHSVSTGQVQAFVALHELRANSLAEALMEEITSLPYTDPDGGGAVGPEDGEANRFQFDNIDDFHGYSESLGQAQDMADNDYPTGFARFSRSVTVQGDTVSVPDLGGDIAGVTITITITDDKGQTWSLSRFVAEPAS